jgi:esterase/lipase superfamily enzyme
MRINWYEEEPDPRFHFTLQDIELLDIPSFISSFKEDVRSTTSKKALLFVHGYATEFKFALFRAAQIAYDTNFDGMTILYSWPSSGSGLNYIYDRDSADQSIPFFKEFLRSVFMRLGAAELVVITHSMGGRLLLGALRELELSPKGVEDLRINNAVLAAPDVDEDVFATQRVGIHKFIAQSTLYASRNDKAMRASRAFGGGIFRIGDVKADGPLLEEGIDSLDVSVVNTDWLGLNHSSYAERTSLLLDVAHLLKTGIRPPDRRMPILKVIKVQRGIYWRFPE